MEGEEGVDIPVELPDIEASRGESIRRPPSLPLLFLFPRTEEVAAAQTLSQGEISDSEDKLSDLGGQVFLGEEV
jgi:hypothetical protein